MGMHLTNGRPGSRSFSTDGRPASPLPRFESEVGLKGERSMLANTTRVFLGSKVRALAARARLLSDLTPTRVGIRPQDLPYAPSVAHFRAANRRFAPALEAHDAIAADCYAAVREAAPRLFRGGPTHPAHLYGARLLACHHAPWSCLKAVAR
jgi:hypothetical protein